MFAVVGDQLLADRYQLPLISETETKEFDAWLVHDQGRLCLAQNYLPKLKPLSLDFAQGKTAYRLKQSQQLREPVGRACGISKGRRPAIVDATAGLAQDGLLLAALGAEVILLEQQPLLHALISDALERARTGPSWLQDIVARIQLQHVDSISWLVKHTTQVVYLDPMYPEPANVRHAQVKKPMQILRNLSGTTTDTSRLFDAALASMTERLVVKRPDWAKGLTDQKPSEVLDTKTHHFDIYFNPA